MWLGAAVPSCGGGADVAGPRTDPGAIEIIAATSGPSPDADGYTVSIDGSGAHPLGVVDTLVLASVSPGTHVVALGGVASNCAVDKGHERTVQVEAGTSPRVTFEVLCELAATIIRVTVTTTGLGPDPDGYSLRLDDGPSRPVSATGTVTFSDVSPGDHSIFLDGLADNCVDTDGSPHAVNASAGMTTSVTFTVECSVPGTIVFSAGIDDEIEAQGEIFVVKSDGTDLRRLTSDRNGDQNPAWSPDGTRIAFWKSAHTGEEGPVLVPGGGLWVMNEDGSSATRLFEQEEVIGSSSPIWSPDGSRIAFSFIEVLSEDPFEYEIHLQVINADGSDLRRLVRTDWHRRPSWSPDGTRLAFARASEDGGDVQIWTVNADGTGLTQLTSLPGMVANEGPVWAPNGRTIAFDNDADGGLYLVDVQGGTPTRLTSGYPGEWSPLGEQLIFTRPPLMLVMNADGTNEKVIATSYQAMGSWSSDGRAIAFADGALSILAVNADGSGRQQLAGPFSGPAIGPVAWSP